MHIVFVLNPKWVPIKSDSFSLHVSCFVILLGNLGYRRQRLNAFTTERCIKPYPWCSLQGFCLLHALHVPGVPSLISVDSLIIHARRYGQGIKWWHSISSLEALDGVLHESVKGPKFFPELNWNHAQITTNNLRAVECTSDVAITRTNTYTVGWAMDGNI